jgi:hypothetical protein
LYDFFLAHAGPDTAEAERLYDLLASETSVFLDRRSIVLGDDWDRTLAEAQKQSRVTVVLVSANTDTAFTSEKRSQQRSTLHAVSQSTALYRFTWSRLLPTSHTVCA